MTVKRVKDRRCLP